MKKTCFRLGISLVYLTLVLTILTGKSVADQPDPFLGYATDSTDNQSIAVFNSDLSSYGYVHELIDKNGIKNDSQKIQSLCNQVRTLKNNQCYEFHYGFNARPFAPYPYDCWPNSTPSNDLRKCNRLWVSDDILNKITDKCKDADKDCQGDKKQCRCYKEIDTACVVKVGGASDGEQRITPQQSNAIKDCIATTNPPAAANPQAAPQTTYSEFNLVTNVTTQCNKMGGIENVVGDCKIRAYAQCVTDKKLFKNNNTTVDQTQYDVFQKCISNYITDLQTTHNKSQLVAYAEGRCVANFSGTGSTRNIPLCAADAYNQCSASANGGKKLDENSTLNQTQYGPYTTCVNSAIDKMKSIKKVVTGSELYWEINPSTRTSKKISISTVANVDLDQIDPSANIVGEQGKNYVMTLYLWFNGYSGECTDSTPKTFCKIIRFTIHYTPAAYSTSGRSLEVGKECIAGTPKFVPESCTGRCKLAGCAEGKGEGSVKVCQRDGKSYGAAMGVCVQECGSQNPGKCKEDPAGGINTATPCDYSESCGNGGTKVCHGKSINGQCTFVTGSPPCESCTGEVGTSNTKRICTPGAYDVQCTKKCNPNPCAQNPGTGEATVQQCKSDGSGWEDKKPECNSQCAQWCGGSNVPKEGTGCTYPEQCPTGGAHTCTGTYQKVGENIVCKYNPAVNPACGDCK